jgi:ABC-type dipeptide/oligopeptide/nickel transport system permease component
MTRFLIRRVIRAIVVLWGVSTVVFIVLHLSGDPVALMVAPDTPPAEIELLRHELGLDEPLISQYLHLLQGIAAGDFGRSLRYGEPAMSVVLDRVGTSLQLAIPAIFLAVLVAVPIGILSAVKRGSVYDSVAMVVALLGQSTPTFFVGIVLILIFSVQLRWLPTGGYGDWRQLILPCVTIAMWSMASIARLTRSAMLEVLSKEYIRTARAKGLGDLPVVIRHALKNAAIPIVTIVGLQAGYLLAGSVVVETLFAWPGVGWLVIQAINARDYLVVQAAIFLIAASFVVINTVVDVLYGVLDPRIRYG